MKTILINEYPWQTRIAITRDGVLENVYFTSPADAQLERSFFRGTVTKMLPSIQTAFVNIGQDRAGFLHISEIDRDLAFKRMGLDDEEEIEAEENTPEEKRPSGPPDISKILKVGDSILVQVAKEPIREKGAKLTTCFTLPGRFVVLMPNIPRIGVSKKIEDKEERQRLKEQIGALVPEGMGVIIRTTCAEQDISLIRKDLEYLVERWHEINQRYNSSTGVTKLYEDLPLHLQIVRDMLDESVDTIICDSSSLFSEMQSFIRKIAPEHSYKLQLYKQSTPILEYYGVEAAIEAALQPKVPLKSGGSIIIESAEAMTVIDVNTGRYTGGGSAEETIFNTNIEAAKEVVRQLRLRNIGGIIVIDFIDMASASDQKKLFVTFEKMLREHDKFQSVVLKVSEFGLVQMTRKRSGKTLQQQLTQSCSCCYGRGFVPSLQSQVHHTLRELNKALSTIHKAKQVILRVKPAIFEYIIEYEYNALLALERARGVGITLEQLPAHDTRTFAINFGAN